MSADAWRPTARRAVLEARAALFAKVRSFFAARGVLEVDTPLLVNHAVSDVHIHAARVPRPGGAALFLHTSPEYAMKRLLAAGSGDIFQICHVVRAFERSRLHNSEFTLLEWYRIGFSIENLMAEVEDLLRELSPAVATGRTEQVSYREAFLRELAPDPLTASLSELRGAAQDAGLVAHADAPDARDDLLDFLMAARIGPALGRQGLTFIHGYPASQAALARLDPRDPRTALRFELYRHGVELANGYHELASPEKQRERFGADNAERARRGLEAIDVDEHLLAALAQLPDCAGVALGLDRLLMLATGATHIDEVIAFPTERA
jgi:elongation factor P--(R)-beta-lysine ligase